MDASADLAFPDDPSASEDPIERELGEIEDLRQRALANRDVLHCSTTARHLVEKEIPRLIEIVRHARRAIAGGVRMPASEEWAQRMLIKLRQEAGILRNLFERR